MKRTVSKLYKSYEAVLFFVLTFSTIIPVTQDSIFLSKNDKIENRSISIDKELTNIDTRRFFMKV